MSKRTLFLIFALFIITSVLLIMALYKPSPINPPITTQTITPIEPVAQTILSFGSLSASASSSIKQSALQTYSLPINISTGKNKVTAIQFELQYDPTVLTSVSVTPGVFFKNPVVLLNQVDVKTGRISYAFGIGLTGQGVVGQDTVATLTFRTKAESDAAKAGLSQETSILFLPKTKVTAEGITQSALKQTSNIQIIVGEKTSTPSAQ